MRQHPKLSEIDLRRFNDCRDKQAIYHELQRIYEFPACGGFFTLLHHLGPVIESSDDVFERVYFILQKKPIKEVLTRLKNIHFVHPDQVRFYNLWKLNHYHMLIEVDRGQRRLSPRFYTYDYLEPEAVEFRLRQDAEWKRLQKAWLNTFTQNVTWNGETIFPPEPIMFFEEVYNMKVPLLNLKI